MAARDRLRNVSIRAAVLALLIAFAWLAMSASPRVGVTYDELGHVTTGYGYWKRNDYRVNAENGILATRVTAVPLLLSNDLKFPPVDSPHWKSCNARALGYEFFYQLGNDFASILHRARLGTLAFGVGLLWLIWRWANRLWGPAAGFIALGLATFSPTLLAHSALATSDLILAFCLLAAVSAWWLLWHELTWTRLLLAGLTAGLAFTAKMSGIVLVPVLAILFGLRAAHHAFLPVNLGRRRFFLRSRASRLGALLSASSLAAVMSLAVIWATYGFRFSASPPDASTELGFISPWSEILTKPPSPVTHIARTASASAESAAPALPQRVIAWARDNRVLPEAFLWGLAYTYQTSRERESFLNGRISSHGWPLFFPLAFLLKSTPVELTLFMLGIVGLAALPASRMQRHRRRARWLYRAAPLCVVFAVYWIVALTTPLNIGHRHLLPVYPMLFVAAGAVVLWRPLLRPVGLAVLVALAAAWQVADSFASRPFYLSYFTPLIGGPREGWHYMVDSSLDWGQGLPDLAAWLKAKERQGDAAVPVFLTYFGSDSPRARNLPVTRFGDARDDHGARKFPHLTGGWYAISATYFQRVYLNLAGPWSEKYEREYMEIGKALRVDPARAATLTAEEREHLRTIAMRYEVLQFGRLCHFLQDRKPDTIIGASLLMFRLSDSDIALALDAPLEELNAHLRHRRAQAR